jgi:hypothetical protein
MFCTRCGTANSDESSYCTNCSSQLTRPRSQRSDSANQPTIIQPDTSIFQDPIKTQVYQPVPVSAPPPNPASQNPPPTPQGYQPLPNSAPQNPPPTPQGYQPYPSSYANQRPLRPGSASGRAITSMILSIISVFTCGPLLSIPGMILGKIEMNAIRDGKAAREGETLAKIGFYFGLVMTVFSCVGGTLWVFYVLAMASAR